MKINKLKLFISTFAFVLLLPNISQSYFTTDQTATRINNETIIFTVTYKFGFATRELYIPIGAVRGTEATGDSPYIGYKIIGDKEEEPFLGGKTTSLAFTTDKNVTIKDNQYYLPAGKSAKFTLITFLNVPAAEQAMSQDYSLLVSRLPFTMIDDKTTIEAHLNPSELQYYLTPSVSLAN